MGAYRKHIGVDEPSWWYGTVASDNDDILMRDLTYPYTSRTRVIWRKNVGTYWGFPELVFCSKGIKDRDFEPLKPNHIFRKEENDICDLYL